MQLDFGSRVAIRPWSWAVALVLTFAAAPGARAAEARSSRGRGTGKTLVQPAGANPARGSEKLSPYGRLLQRRRAMISAQAPSTPVRSGGIDSSRSSKRQTPPQR